MHALFAALYLPVFWAAYIGACKHAHGDIWRDSLHALANEARHLPWDTLWQSRNMWSF